MHPDSPIKNLVDFVSFTLIFFISVYVPFVFSFDIDTSQIQSAKCFEIFIDIWFLLEMALNFFTGYYQNGIVVMDRKHIALNYIKTWFFPDIVSSFPYSFFYFRSSTSSMLVAQ